MSVDAICRAVLSEDISIFDVSRCTILYIWRSCFLGCMTVVNPQCIVDDALQRQVWQIELLYSLYLALERGHAICTRPELECSLVFGTLDVSLHHFLRWIGAVHCDCPSYIRNVQL